MTTETDIQSVQAWLDEFNAATESHSSESQQNLWVTDAYWRDVVALGREIKTVVGKMAIATELPSAIARSGFVNLTLDTRATPPRWVTRAGVACLESFVVFETRVGRGAGVLRLKQADQEKGTQEPGNPLLAWTLLTALQELKGFEAAVGANRPTGQVHSRDFKGPNWLDKRISATAFEDRDPAVLVVGAGQAGLSIAARLTQLGVDTLVIEKNPRVGDNWRNRYHALTLHNQVYANHLPYMPFPPNWPVYIPKDKLANWFECYAEAMELNVWTSSELLQSSYSADQQRWDAKVKMMDGSVRAIKPRHIVMATSISGKPRLPDIPELKNYTGEVIHASDYRDGEDHNGKSVLVLGAGTSAHDIAQDLASSEADVTMVQRGSTMIVNIEPGAQLPYTLYHEGPSLEECDLITTAMPVPLMRDAHVGFTAKAKEQDWPLLEQLQQRGMTLDYGPEETGWQFKYLTRGGGYYFNVGASQMIADGKIGLIQFNDIESFQSSGVKLKDGSHLNASLIVLATGYQGMSAMVEQLFGKEVAENVGPIWGFDNNGHELRNMYCETPQPGLWFMAGSFAQCRINSRYLALQIKANEEALN